MKPFPFSVTVYCIPGLISHVGCTCSSMALLIVWSFYTSAPTYHKVSERENHNNEIAPHIFHQETATDVWLPLNKFQGFVLIFLTEYIQITERREGPLHTACHVYSDWQEQDSLNHVNIKMFTYSLLTFSTSKVVHLSFWAFSSMGVDQETCFVSHSLIISL